MRSTGSRRQPEDQSISTFSSDAVPLSTRPGLSLALLSNGASPHNDNHNRIITALEDAGWGIEVFAHHELSVLDGVVCGRQQPLEAFDLLWMLGLGERHDFMDRCQILANLPPAKLLNSAQAMLTMHSKHVALPHAPISCSGNLPEQLLAFATRHPDIKRWVVKPAASSYGRDVLQVQGTEELERALHRATAGRKYCVMQAFVEEINDGETRSLVVNGEIIGSYLRIPEHDFLANLSRGARARAVKLTPRQTLQVKEVAAALIARGVRFAAIDMAFPYLIEVNIANPGGLATLASLEGSKHPDIGQRLAAALRQLAVARS